MIHALGSTHYSSCEVSLFAFVGAGNVSSVSYVCSLCHCIWACGKVSFIAPWCCIPCSMCTRTSYHIYVLTTTITTTITPNPGAACLPPGGADDAAVHGYARAFGARPPVASLGRGHTGGRRYAHLFATPGRPPPGEQACRVASQHVVLHHSVLHHIIIPYHSIA